MSNERLEKNLSFIRHELRTPVNAIIGYSEMLMEEVEENGHTDYAPDLKKIREAGGRLQNLISDLLAAAQIEQSDMFIAKSTSESTAQDIQTPSLSHVKIPEALFKRLNDAAEIHNVTELKACLKEVANINEGGKEVADYLQGFMRRYDMDSLLNVLGTLQPA